MFDQMVQYWYYTGDDTYNEVVTQGLLAQIGPDEDFMPPNQTRTEVIPMSAHNEQGLMTYREMTIKPSGHSLHSPQQSSNILTLHLSSHRG